MKNNKDNKISVRLDEEAAVNLEDLIKNTGWTKTQIINELLKQGNKIWFIDGKRLAEELHQLNLELSKENHDEDMKTLITRLCEKVYEVLYKFYEEYEAKAEQEKKNGNIESD